MKPLVFLFVLLLAKWLNIDPLHPRHPVHRYCLSISCLCIITNSFSSGTTITSLNSSSSSFDKIDRQHSCLPSPLLHHWKFHDTHISFPADNSLSINVFSPWLIDIWAKVPVSLLNFVSFKRKWLESFSKMHGIHISYLTRIKKNVAKCTFY